MTKKEHLSNKHRDETILAAYSQNTVFVHVVIVEKIGSHGNVFKRRNTPEKFQLGLWSNRKESMLVWPEIISSEKCDLFGWMKCLDENLFAT